MKNGVGELWFDGCPLFFLRLIYLQIDTVLVGTVCHIEENILGLTTLLLIF